jgi:hypothetical protein
MIDGIVGQLVAAFVFLLVYGGAWLYRRRSEAARGVELK